MPEGSTVAVGDTLIEFDATQLEIELDNNMAAFRGTDRRIDRNRIESGIETGSIGVFKSVAELELEVAESVKIEDASIYSRREILDASLDKDYASHNPRAALVHSRAEFNLEDMFENPDDRSANQYTSDKKKRLSPRQPATRSYGSTGTDISVDCFGPDVRVR